MLVNLRANHKVNLVVILVVIPLIMISAAVFADSKTKIHNSIPGAQATADELSIKELGVKIPLSPDLAGLSYKTIPGPKDAPSLQVIQLDSPKYSGLVNKCIGSPARRVSRLSNFRSLRPPSR